MSLEVIVSDEVKKRIKRLQKSYRNRIIERLESLSKFPHFLDIKKLKGKDSVFRLRVGLYRVVFEVD